MKTSYVNVLSELLPDKIYRLVLNSSLSDFQEVRIRIGKPLVLVSKNKSYLLNDKYKCTSQDIKAVILNACNNSFHSYKKYVDNGFIPIKDGGRIGIAGSYNGGSSIDDVSSLNIRLSNQVKNVSDKLFQFAEEIPKSILIVGPPGSGKTTLLRDLIYNYSSNGWRVSLADERGELSSFDLGANCDYIVGMDKGEAILRLLRTMNPQIICFDEIGSEEEAKGVKKCFQSGVKIICTLHAEGVTSACKRLKYLMGGDDLFDVMAVMNEKFEIEKMINRVYT